jgi:serine/threonine protein kinase
VLDGGRYRIARLIKAGSFGAVYRAEQLRLNGQVCAVKELRDDVIRTPDEQAEVETWFDREATLLMGLSHPMIPEIRDRFTERGRRYLVMAFIEGCDLGRSGRGRLAVGAIVCPTLQLPVYFLPSLVCTTRSKADS